jgi:glycosyltransferase involved in cell wall biosynthesis
MLGKKIKKIFGLKLILDYGDPWSFNPSNETIPSWRKFIDKMVEKKIIYNSDFITVTTKRTYEEFLTRFSINKNKLAVIPQGVDSLQYNEAYLKYNYNTEREETPKNKLMLFYSGLFYKDIRNPSNFFKALSNIKSEILENLELDIIIAGNMEKYVLDLVEKLEFCDRITIKFIGNIEFRDVLQYQVICDGLLFFGNNGSVQVPGKLYEYIAARKPIFTIAPTYDEACEIINNLNRGVIVENDIDEISNGLLDFIKRINSKDEQFNLKKIDYYDWTYIGDNYKKIIRGKL